MLSRDFRDILSAFSDAGVEYLLVGAYALSAHGLVRAADRPKDRLDLRWLEEGREPGE
jgi:hypothetical protein